MNESYKVQQKQLLRQAFKIPQESRRRVQLRVPVMQLVMRAVAAKSLAETMNDGQI
jgi:hypothetical protein